MSSDPRVKVTLWTKTYCCAATTISMLGPAHLTETWLAAAHDGHLLSVRPFSFSPRTFEGYYQPRHGDCPPSYSRDTRSVSSQGDASCGREQGVCAPTWRVGGNFVGVRTSPATYFGEGATPPKPANSTWHVAPYLTAKDGCQQVPISRGGDQQRTACHAITLSSILFSICLSKEIAYSMAKIVPARN